MRSRLLLTLFFALVAAACADDDPVGVFAGDRAAGADEPALIDIPDDALDLTGFDTIDIDIQDNSFVQRVVVVSPGTEITWTNNGRNEHNVRPSVEGAFEPISTLALAEKGMSASLTFDSPGDFPYYCSLHGTADNGQTGRVIVVP